MSKWINCTPHPPPRAKLSIASAFPRILAIRSALALRGVCADLSAGHKWLVTQMSWSKERHTSLVIATMNDRRLDRGCHVDGRDLGTWRIPCQNNRLRYRSACAHTHRKGASSRDSSLKADGGQDRPFYRFAHKRIERLSFSCARKTKFKGRPDPTNFIGP